jgi:3-hydroxyisobutyrate dehydrogenase/glyoxylate/succinic semialdehyde reductase
VLFTMPSLPDAVAATALGHSEFLNAMRPGSIWINSSTVNASFAQLMADDARAKGVRYLDAPVIGSKEAAARGELVFMVGGDTSDLDVCRPLLACMGKRIVHVGGHGLGSSLKMVNNLLAAVAALGQALGVPRQTIFDTFHVGPEGRAAGGPNARQGRRVERITTRLRSRVTAASAAASPMTRRTIGRAPTR